ncbi:hypothetical protein [uncultured Metabacillus sp.]|uniref:hypothetical protein n=1 Tax=uncultured Metabacillus sp. TaxID=2860135 RepID=UPI0026176C0B|nr:hypothetical protein [uncultured Metabacillus sp.]
MKVEKLINYLQNNPQEALAIVEGKASPAERLSTKELLEVIKTIVSDKSSNLMKYWG